MRPFTFVLSHAGGESVVLAAESEKEMHEWMQAVRTSRMCVSDVEAANMLEEARQKSADDDLDSARDKRTDPESELARIEGELESVQAEHRQLEVEKESAEKQVSTQTRAAPRPRLPRSGGTARPPLLQGVSATNARALALTLPALRSPIACSSRN